MRRKLAVPVAGTILLLAVAHAWAHHSFSAEFDLKKPIHFTGTLTKVEWVNPHTWLHVDVKAPDGQVTSWMLEAGTPNVLFRRGFTKASVPVGIEVVVDGFQAKDGSPKGSARDLTFPDGRKVFLGADPGSPGAPDEENRK
jgi:Family of unknown function (DUF6152)